MKLCIDPMAGVVMPACERNRSVPFRCAWVVAVACSTFVSQAVVQQDLAAQEAPVSRIAFGSCASQQRPCPIWGAIADYRPDMLLLLGDNIYADVLEGRLVPSTPARIAEAYEQLASLPDFQRLRTKTPILATWDDHDYGDNDAGVEWEHKDVAAKLFHDFFGTPDDSPLRKQQGIYNAKIIGPPGKRVQIIMLDTRFFRSPLSQSETRMPGWRSRPYIPATGPSATMLGEAQWEWLAEQLRQPAELRIIGSSIQVISDEHPFEKWGNFPDEQQRLYALIRDTRANGVVIISGDRHLGDISVENSLVGYPLYDITASGLNQATLAWRPTEPNSRRVAALPYGNHFGTIEVDWDSASPTVRLQLRHDDGEIAVQAQVPLHKLTPPPAEILLAEGISSPAQAIQANEGDELVVQFAVASGRELEGGNRILLNSESDFRNSGNFTVVVENAKGKVTLDRFLSKTIRATGKVSLYNDRKQLRVAEATSVEIVE